MSTDQEVISIIRTWLREDGHESADRVLEDVLGLLAGNTQRQPLPAARRISGIGAPVWLGLASAAVIAVLVGVNLLPSVGIVGSPTDSPVSSPSSTLPVATPGQNDGYTAIEPGTYEIPWLGGRIRLDVPAGWMTADLGCVGGACWPELGAVTLTHRPIFGPALMLGLVHDVDRIVSDVCWGIGGDYSPVGPTVEDLSAAILDLEGVVRSGPTPTVLGGYPALRFEIRPDACGAGPDGYDVWTNKRANGFWILDGGDAAIYVVDVDGERLVLTTVDRVASPELAGELATMLDSIEIEPGEAPGGGVAPTTFFAADILDVGRHTMVLAGVPLSVEVSQAGTGNLDWESNGDFYISKSTTGSQGAEAAILWTSVPNDGYPMACPDVLEANGVGAASDVAAAVAAAAVDSVGLAGPTEVTIGGRTAQHVAFTIGTDHGCQPGFFHTWPDIYGGALVGSNRAGDSIRVWIVDVGGTLLFIEAITTPEASEALRDELQVFVDSIRFE